jgi:hypothetical protein
MNLYVLRALSPLGLMNTTMIARMLDLQSAAHDDVTDAPYPLPSQVADEEKTASGRRI